MMTTLSSGESDPASPSDETSSSRWFQKKFLLLAFGSVGVVFGDVGTSPLYTIKECFHGKHAIHPDPANILGVLSLIFWSMLIVVSIKYIIFILRADNRGEGGIFALLSLVTSSER
jgi:KUP system potassium uptake protein